MITLAPGLVLPTRQQYKAIYVLGRSGCLHPSTPIYDPVDGTTRTVFDRYVAAQPFHVVSLNNDDEPVIAQAEPPCQFTIEPMYRVILITGEVITVTAQHRLFVGDGYRTIAEIANSCAQPGGFASFPLPTISAADLRAWFVNAPHWKQRPGDSQDGCHPEYRLYDRPLHEGVNNAPTPAPLRADVLTHHCAGSDRDGLAGRDRHTPWSSCDLLAKQDFAPPVNNEHWDESVLPRPQGISARSYIWHRADEQPHSYFVPSHRDEWPQRSFRSTIAADVAVCRLAEDIFAEWKQRNRPGLPLPGAWHHPDREQTPAGQVQSEDREKEAYKKNICLYGIPGTTQCQIIGIEPAGKAIYYDFHVPVLENYWACGVFHHNTGKSNLLGRIALQCHAQGEGVVVVDTKDGALTRQLARITPYPEKTVLVSPGSCYFDHQWHYWGLNVMEYEHASEGATVADNIVTRVLDMFERTGDLKGDFTQVRRYLTLGVRVAIARPGATLIDVRKVLTEPAYGAWVMKHYTVIPEVKRQAEQFYRLNEYQRLRETSSTLPRILDYIVPPIFNFTVGQDKTSILLQEWLDDGYMVLFDLKKGVETRHAIMFGNLVVALIMQSAFSRPSIEDEHTRTWRIILDEFHRIAPYGYPDLIDLLRFANVFPVFAHQHRGQLQRAAGMENKLLESIETIPINIFFAHSTQDETYITKSRPQFADKIKAFQIDDHYAFFEAKDCPPGYGFPDIGQVQKLVGRTSKEEQRAQLDKLVANQRPFTRPKVELAEEHRRRYYAENPEEPVQTRPQRQGQTARDDSAGQRSPATAGRTAFSRKRPG